MQPVFNERGELVAWVRPEKLIVIDSADLAGTLKHGMVLKVLLDDTRPGSVCFRVMHEEQ